MLSSNNKICFISPSFHFKKNSGPIGGGEISNRDLLIRLSQDSNVTIITATGDGGWGKKNDNIKSFEISELIQKYIRSKKISDILAKIFFKNFVLFHLKKNKYDTILGSTYAAYAIKKHLSSNKNCSGALFVRAFENFSFFQKKELWIKKLIRTLIYGNNSEETLRKLSFIMVNSNFMKIASEKTKLNSRIYIIYPTINIKNSAYKKINKINEIRMISTNKNKGFELFIDLANIYPNLNFSVAGKKYIGEKKIPENLKMIGWLPDSSDFIKKADLFLVPSKIEETFGRVSVEATALGTRVLVSNKGGLPETVLNHKELILDSDNINEWHQKIDSLIKEPNHLDNIYKKIQPSIYLYTLENQYKKLLEAINENNTKK